MYIISLRHGTPLPFVPAPLLLSSWLTPPSCSCEDRRLIEEHGGSDGELESLLSDPLSLSHFLSVSQSLNRPSWKLPDNLSAFESSSGTKCTILLLLKSE